jgi:hypothetical protein
VNASILPPRKKDKAVFGQIFSGSLGERCWEVRDVTNYNILRYSERCSSRRRYFSYCIFLFFFLHQLVGWSNL